MKTKILKKSILLVCSLALLTQVYLWAEPTRADTDTDSVIVTLEVDSGITITEGIDVAMAPNIGVGSNTSIGGTSWIVKTNNEHGYNLNVKASTAPALKHSNGTNFFSDYTEATSGTPETWSVASGGYEFGFSAYGEDVASLTWGTGIDCGTSATISTNGLKYVGFKPTDKTIATRNSMTDGDGTQTNICFAAEQKDIYVPSGEYTATITATAMTI